MMNARKRHAWEVIAAAVGIVLGGLVVSQLHGVAPGSGLTNLGVLAMTWFVVAFTVWLIGLTVVRAVASGPDRGAGEEAFEAEARAFREVGNVDTLGTEVAPLFWERELWIKRRVEQISIADRSTVRRRISV